jgi:hypothetical protein
VEKNFICINVSDPGDQFLIEQGRFHCTTMFSQDLFELPEADVERVPTEATFPQVFIYILGQSNLAEFALILECEAMRINESKEHSGMLRRSLVTLEILKRAGHAEMQAEPEVIIDAHKQMFAMATTRFEAPSLQSPCQFTRRNAFQDVRAPHVDAGDPLVQRPRVEVSLECFNLGQLWHGTYVCT